MNAQAQIRSMPSDVQLLGTGTASFVYRDRHFKTEAIKVLPGEYYATGSEIMIVTLLGSCVAACLRDEQAQVGGMNHFLLPHDHCQDASSGARFGLYAMEVLVNALLAMGARRERLEAKVFGGANVLGDIGGGHFNVGQANVEFAFEFLQQEDIPVVAHDVGGDYGRNILFDGRDMSVYVRIIDGQSQTQSLAAAERQWYDCQRQEQRREEKKRVIFWDD